MAFFGQPSLAALLPLSAGQNLADVPDKTAALANLGTLSTSDIMLNSVPIGTIIPFWGNTAPVGYLPCNGQTVNSGTFPDLVTFLGGGSSQVLPDLRGEFLRGWDNGRGVDAGRAIKTAQAGQVESHEHAARQGLGLNLSTGSNGLIAFSNTGIGSALPTGAVGTYGGTETRPRNVSVLYCMKAYGALVNTSTANMGNVLTELSQCTKLTQFGSSLGSQVSGYQKLPSGMIMQWGYAGSIGTASNNLSITFPIAFPTACVSVSLTPFASTGGYTSSLNGGALTTTTAQGTVAINGTITTGITTQFLALGY